MHFLELKLGQRVRILFNRTDCDHLKEEKHILLSIKKLDQKQKGPESVHEPESNSCLLHGHQSLTQTSDLTLKSFKRLNLLNMHEITLTNSECNLIHLLYLRMENPADQ